MILRARVGPFPSHESSILLDTHLGTSCVTVYATIEADGLGGRLTISIQVVDDLVAIEIAQNPVADHQHVVLINFGEWRGHIHTTADRSLLNGHGVTPNVI